ncbi:tRNA pseudouridine(38-40) synthase TruA [Nakamurella flavida]|uniref:tRNA pseudouridine synthase A n=1 Tax=Nakamurella flavida TaxID=363630 RepID=A0A939C2C4_9ACTN|nr:tRNA pseudouridine(38-40) synthase TruA [Nakamurella flavida]MBM9475891.1 tRNA pseudouridine(38-40) synthase TruA [Nakamurella flavida]MBM9478449.1 tRNA pseudouridine(38-40) synthase TruA [Nakamurella flavida]MDP9777823.1 tRNA pseudouridine38-40 synthase [Nakamurella flavida]
MTDHDGRPQQGAPVVVVPGVQAGPGPASVRLRLDLSYDGTDFSGWAVQPGRRTVAGVLGESLRTVLRAPVPLVVAGRTDAGVHALGQVAHIDVDPTALAALTPRQGNLPAPTAALVGLNRRLAGLLPPDVRVRGIAAAAPGFDARFAALRRHYRYRVATSDWGASPMDRSFVLALRRELDHALMRRSATALLGLHDFAAFCRPREGATTIRELQRLDVERVSGDEVHILVSADAFCHSMVRALVGALVAVGQGRAPVEMPAAVLAAGVRTAAVHVAPAHGLTLMAVDYPPDRELADRVGATRATRSADEVG